MRRGENFVVLLLTAVLFVSCAYTRAYGGDEPELLNVAKEEMLAHRDRAEKILKDEVCPKIKDGPENTLCNNLRIKVMMDYMGFAFVDANGCNVIVIDMFISRLPELSWGPLLAHEVGHIVTQKCMVSSTADEIEADLYAAKVFGRENVKLWLKNMYAASPYEFQKIWRAGYIARTLALNGL